MKKNSQVRVLLILFLICLAALLFFYYNHPLKFTEGATPNNQKENQYTDNEYASGQKSGGVITGEYIPMSKQNKHSVSTILRDLENDFDREIPIIKTQEKKLSETLNALQLRVAKIEQYAQPERPGPEPEPEPESRENNGKITHSETVVIK